MPTLKAVIFDHSTIFVSQTTLQSELRTLLIALKDLGLAIGVFATNSFDIDANMVAYGYPPVDLFLTRQEVGKNKGAKEWMNVAAGRLRISKSQILYVGDERRDYMTATNGPTFYIQARWTHQALPDLLAIHSFTPSDVLVFVTHFLMLPSRFVYSLDVPGHGLYVRSLLDSNTSLLSTEPRSFTPLHLLRDKLPVKVGDDDAIELLGLHALSSLNVEGHVNPNSFFTCYPSSTPGKENAVLSKVVQACSKLLHGYYRPDVLVRSMQAINTSDARRAKRDDIVTFTVQTNSVYVNENYRGKLRERTLIVFDDFTTSGMSLDWARTLLLAAGAEKVILIAIGKFRYSHNLYVAKDPKIITPFDRKDYSLNDFTLYQPRMSSNEEATQMLRRSFGALCKNEPYSNEG